MSMPEHDKLVQDFKEARAKYRELYAKIIDIGVKGVIDPRELSAAKCEAGGSYHGGCTDIDLGKVIQPLKQR